MSVEQARCRAPLLREQRVFLDGSIDFVDPKLSSERIAPDLLPGSRKPWRNQSSIDPDHPFSVGKLW
jgi:hypothetical protein